MKNANTTGRPPLSDTEPTVTYTIKMPKGLRDWARRVGPSAIRKILTKAKK